MKAWALVENNAPLECIEIEDRQLNGSEVELEVTHCGVCHSDLHIWRGWYDLGGGKKLMLADRGITLPRALGHEIFGRVSKLGPDAKGVRIGDKRIVYPWIGCGQCYLCARGDENLCDNIRSLGIKEHGGFASHVVVPDARYLIDPGNIDPAWAATLACSGLTVHSALKKILPIDPKEPVLLIGCGGLGLAAIAMLKARGHNHIVALDTDEAKLEAARVAGATIAMSAKTADLPDALRAATGRLFAAVLDFVNSQSTSKLGLDLLAKNGNLILVGVGTGELSISLPLAVFRSTAVRGTTSGTLQELKEVVELANAGRLTPVPITLHNKAEANAALTALHDGKVIGRLVLV